MSLDSVGAIGGSMVRGMSLGKVLAGRTIVVVDDHAGMRELLHDALTSAGARVLRAANAYDGLALVVEHEVHALVSDLRMPAMTGLDLARAVRDLGTEKSNIVAVAVSGDDSWRYVDPNRAAVAGFDYHMMKPIDPQLLVGTVHELIQRRTRAASGTLPRVGETGVERAQAPRGRAARRRR